MACVTRGIRSLHRLAWAASLAAPVLVPVLSPVPAQAQATLQKAIQTSNGHYITAVNRGGIGGPETMALRSDATAPGPSEVFSIVWLDPRSCRFALRTPANTYVTAVRGGGVGEGDPASAALHTDAVKIGPWEEFTILVRADGQSAVILTPDRQHYLSAARGGGIGGSDAVALHTDARTIGPWERFRLVTATPTRCGAGAIAVPPPQPQRDCDPMACLHPKSLPCTPERCHVGGMPMPDPHTTGPDGEGPLFVKPH